MSRLRILPLVIAAPLVLAACGGSSSKSSSSASTATTPAAAPATTPAAAQGTPSGHIAVTLKEFTVTPAPPVGKAGSVTFAVTNAGHVPHELVVIKTNKPAADLNQGGEADEAGSVGETGELNAGASKSVTFKLAAGHYALICNLPGHYVAGQHTDFTVK